MNEFVIAFKKRLYSFTLKLIKEIEILPNEFVTRRLSDQLLRSGTSVMANYIEGQSASSRKDLTNFLNYSSKSCKESIMWISLLKDTGKMNENKAIELISELDEFYKIINSSVLTLRKTESKIKNQKSKIDKNESREI